MNVIYGCHPHFADCFDSDAERLLRELLRRHDVVGLGEIGLDYSRKNTVDPDVQRHVFRTQLKMALEFELPLCLHLRDDNGEGFYIMEEASR